MPKATYTSALDGGTTARTVVEMWLLFVLWEILLVMLLKLK
jgi:hypothetical protein